MGRKAVEHNIDLANLPPLTAGQEAELKALAARADSAVD